MTVSIEVFNDTSVLEPGRHCIGRKKISVEGVWSQAVEVSGKRDFSEISELYIQFHCSVCRYRVYADVELRKIVLWDEGTKEYSNFVCIEEEIDASACEHCAELKANTCQFPCFDPECLDHPAHEWDYYEGWIPKKA